MKAFTFTILTAFLFTTLSCSKKKSEESTSTSTKDSSVSGKISSISASSLKNGKVQTLATKTVTHIMAVSPSTANATRYVAEVSSDGTFSLSLDSGKPWLIVFVSQNGTLTGADMIVGIVNVAANGLDTLPLAQAGSVALGDITVDQTTTVATPSTSVTDLLSTLGVSSAEATFIGGMDDLALRLANPDVDGNGVIDANESKNFSLDWHVRATTKLGANELLISDVTDTFADPANVTLTWTLASAYAIYDKTYDDTEYPVQSGGSLDLKNGGAFTASGTSVNATSYSGLTYGSWRGFGPDYNMTSQEIGGSDAKATFVYTLGSSSKKLTFSNVRTRTKSSLSSAGTVMPFVKVNTSGGKITGIDYKWMKKTASSWELATTAEVNLLVQSSSGYISMNTSKSGTTSTNLGFKIPSTAVSGTVNVNDPDLFSTNISDPTSVTPAQVCSSALSYDDKMGLRLFAGGFGPQAGTTACP